jgi:HTH-type transcriptional regulator/antitoxin HipB
MANPRFQAIYEEEAAKKELWLQLVEARQAAGLTQAEVAKRLGVSQAQVARIEKRGYDAYTLNTPRRYVQALGEDFTLQVAVRRGQNVVEATQSIFRQDAAQPHSAEELWVAAEEATAEDVIVRSQ